MLYIMVDKCKKIKDCGCGCAKKKRTRKPKARKPFASAKMTGVNLMRIGSEPISGGGEVTKPAQIKKMVSSETQTETPKMVSSQTQTQSAVSKYLPQLKTLLKRQEEPVEKKEKRVIKDNILSREEPVNRGYSVVRRARSISRPAGPATNVPQFIKALETRQAKQEVVKKEIKEVKQEPKTEIVPEQIKRRGRPRKRVEIQVPNKPSVLEQLLAIPKQ